MIREHESLLKANERLKQEQELMMKNKDVADAQIMVLKKSLEALQKDLEDKETLVVFFINLHVSGACQLFF